MCDLGCDPLKRWISIAVCMVALAGCGKSEPDRSTASIVEHASAPSEEFTSTNRFGSAGSEAEPSSGRTKNSKAQTGTMAIPSLNGPEPLLPADSHNTALPKSDAKTLEGEAEHRLAEAEASSVGDSQRLQPAVEYTLGDQIDVYFATDRLPTAELLPSPIRTFAPAAIVAMLACALFIGLSAARRFQALWLIGSGMAVCMTLIVLQSSIVRWQQYSRLASNAATRFSTLRFETSSDFPLHVGVARVSLPRVHQPGGLESPSVFRLEFTEDPQKHILLQSLVVNSSSETWFEKLSEQMDGDEGREGFIFIHGYNVKFGDALKRTAQLTHDLDIRGPSICYSWPSRGHVLSYATDEASVSWSAPHFEKLILDLRNRADCKNINIVAHSMGNRALLEAIERLHLRSNDSTKLINTLVLAAPDVDASEFTARYVVPVQAIAERTTLYFSEGDRALMLSNRIHQADRLGFNAASLPRLDGIEAVHIGEQPFYSIGHSYYGSDVAVLDDMRMLLKEGKSASQREFLRSATAATGTSFWQLDRALHAQASSATIR